MRQTDKTIKYVEEGSYAWEAGINSGDKLLKINGHDFHDILEYRYLMSEYEVELEVEKADGTIEVVIIENDYEDIGIEFKEELIDKAQSCTNKCIFCFIDQLPKGMRETVYFKDDDTRLSFLQGNYVTLTNLSDEEIESLIAMHVSPINISVHTTNPELRKTMLCNRFAGKCYDIMQKFAQNDIVMNCQIVLCRGINDEDELNRSLCDMAKLYPAVGSISVVPVGLTKHREGLHKLEAYDAQSSKKVIEQVEKLQQKFLDELGTRLVYLSDEFYLNCGMDIPNADEYEGFPQIENGVGLIASMQEEFDSAIKYVKSSYSRKKVAIITGEIAAPFIEGLAKRLSDKTNIQIDVYPVKNNFFGGGVNVAGLVCGSDIKKQLKGKIDAEIILIPDVMLRDNDRIFLDDVTVEELEEEFATKIESVYNDGYEFIEKITGEELEI